MRVALIVVVLGCVSRTAPADGWLQKDEGGVIVDSAMVYERYYSAEDRWCVGIGTTTMDAGLTVGVDAKFGDKVRVGHNSPLGMLTVGSGYGADYTPISAHVWRQNGVCAGDAAVVVNDWCESPSPAMVVAKRAGFGNALYLQKNPGNTESAFVVESSPGVTDGRSVHVIHRGDGIAFGVHNDDRACQDAGGEWIDCIVGGVINPDAVSVPMGELIELRDAGDNTTVDLIKVGSGMVATYVKSPHPGDNGQPMMHWDNRAPNVAFLFAQDSTTGELFFALSRTSARFGSGVGVMISASDSPGEPSEALHIQNGNVLIEGNLIIDDGYVKLGRVYSEPPAADCDQQGEIGRQAWDGEDKTLWMCAADYSWVSMQLQ